MTSKIERLRKWLHEGNDPLGAQMEDSLRPPELEFDSENSDSAWYSNDTAFEHISLRQKLRHSQNHRLYYFYYSVMAVLVCLGMIGVLLYAAVHMPSFGNPDTLMDSELTEFYVENGLKDTGATNIVTGIILNYRGFDTLGESHVLFAAVCTVMLLLRMVDDDPRERILTESDDRYFEPKNDQVLQTSARFLIPCILMFGIYILMNGHLSPGGGFSGGAILGAGMILYLAAFGYRNTERFMNPKTFRCVSACALLFYTCSKGYHFLTAANGIESGIPIGTPGNILSGGLLLPLSIAVGCVVAMTMYVLYTMFRKGDF